MNVGEAFLHDPENSDFQILRESPEIGREIEINLNLAAFGEPFHKQTKSRRETDFIQQRWMQQMRDSAEFAG